MLTPKLKLTLAALVTAATCALSAAPAQAQNAGYAAISFEPAFGLGGDMKIDGTQINLGAELALPAGEAARYHLGLRYATVGGINGFRVDPLGAGWAMPLFEHEDLRLELEPMLSLLHLTYFNSRGDDLLMLGSGLEARLNVFFQQLYVGFTPIALDFRYFATASGHGDSMSMTGLGLDYRLHVLIGMRY